MASGDRALRQRKCEQVARGQQVRPHRQEGRRLSDGQRARASTRHSVSRDKRQERHQRRAGVYDHGGRDQDPHAERAKHAEHWWSHARQHQQASNSQVGRLLLNSTTPIKIVKKTNNNNKQIIIFYF